MSEGIAQGDFLVAFMELVIHSPHKIYSDITDFGSPTSINYRLRISLNREILKCGVTVD